MTPATLDETSGNPARAWVVPLALALSVRVAVICASLAVASPAGGIDALAELHDGRGYLELSEALRHPGLAPDLSKDARRLFPGYPALVAVASSLMRPELAALAVAVTGAAAAVLLFYWLVGDAWAAAYFAVLTPSWVVFSSTAMSEGPFLAMALAAALSWRRNRFLMAGLAAGMAAIIRPVGLVVLVALWWRGADGAWRRRLHSALGASIPIGIWVIASRWLFDRGPENLELYLSKDFALPLQSMLAGFGDPLADPLKVAQVAVTLGLVGLAALALVRNRDVASPVSWSAWLAAVTGFYLLLPSSWVFECLPRFLIAALPAVWAGLRPWLPRRASVLALCSLAAFGISVFWTVRALGG